MMGGADDDRDRLVSYHLEPPLYFSVPFDATEQATVFYIDGDHCRQKPSLMIEFGRVFDFAEGTGRGYDALYDRLTDLAWLQLPQRVELRIDHFASLLVEESAEEARIFVELLKDVSAFWKSELKHDDEIDEFIVTVADSSSRANRALTRWDLLDGSSVR